MFSTAGSQLMIGGARSDWRAAVIDTTAFVGEAWTEIGGATNLGTIGGEWTTQDVTLPNPYAPDEPSIADMVKSVQPARTAQIAVDFDPADAGQVKLLQAEQSVDAYAFRIVFPNASERLFMTIVTGVGDRMDESNNVVGLVFSLVLKSNVVRL